MSELRVKSTGTLKLFESDNTSSVTIASPASLGADRTITLPDGDVTLTAGTMLTDYFSSTYFDVRMSADQSISASTATKVDFDTEVTDLGSNFDTATQSYTAPTAGYYVFNAALHIASQSDSQLSHSHMKLISTPDGGSAVGIAPSSFDKNSNNQRRQAHTVSFIRLMGVDEVMYVEGYATVSAGTPSFLWESSTSYTNFFQGWRIA